MPMETQEIQTKEKQPVEGTEKTRPGRYYTPDVDIFEQKNGLKLIADMPGVKEGDVDVTLDDNVLTIEGHISTNLYEGLSPLYTEYNVGNYFRQFVLNENIDASKIRARTKNGVLE